VFANSQKPPSGGFFHFERRQAGRGRVQCSAHWPFHLFERHAWASCAAAHCF
jgi:hypothetical protein